jgi:glycosyltransferase involved in cell wall biosynthesis
MANYVKDIAIKKVLDVSDALSLRYQTSYHLRSDIFKLIEYIESKRLKQYEARIMEKFNLNLIASARDREYFFRFLSVHNLLVVPNGVETKQSVPKVVTNQKKIVFFANFRAFPNRDAFIYFYRKIFPLVKKQINDVKFTVVGANIERKIYSLAFRDSAFEVYRDVKEIEPFIEDACVSVAPMRISVGIQNKILQSMALKVPVVATPVAMGGIEAVPGRDILLADDPQDFADKVASLIRDPDLRAKLSDRAYQLVEEYFQWPKIIDRLEQACQEIIA